MLQPVPVGLRSFSAASASRFLTSLGIRGKEKKKKKERKMYLSKWSREVSRGQTSNDLASVSATAGSKCQVSERPVKLVDPLMTFAPEAKINSIISWQLSHHTDERKDASDAKSDIMCKTLQWLGPLHYRYLNGCNVLYINVNVKWCLLKEGTVVQHNSSKSGN